MTATRYVNAIFDLDGTLVDSLPGIEASTRFALERCAPELDLPDLRSLIGPPIASMFARCWPNLPTVKMDALVAAFRQHYDSAGCLMSQLYPEVLDTLSTLNARGLTLFVLTNKPLAPARRILEHRGTLPFFREVISPDSTTPPFTRKAEGARLLRRRFELEPGSTLLLGDGMDDLEAAAECGYTFAIAAYGYGSATRDPRAELTRVERFPDIGHILLEEPSRL